MLSLLKKVITIFYVDIAVGTNLKNLLTTATYDRKNREFILNTPMPDGMKYWPGSCELSFVSTD